MSRIIWDGMQTIVSERGNEALHEDEVGRWELAEVWDNPERIGKRFVWLTLGDEALQALNEDLEWEREQLSWTVADGDATSYEVSLLGALKRWKKHQVAA